MARALTMTRKELAQLAARDGRMGDALAMLDRTTPPRATPRRRDALLDRGAASARGRTAHARGASFQAEVRDSLRADDERCTWAEGNPRVRGAPGKMFPVEPATVDFQILTEGIAIAFDCKSISHGAEYSLAKLLGAPRDRERHERQLRWLLDFRKHGGIAFLLLYEKALDRAWLCFALRTLLSGESVKVRTLTRAALGVPQRVVDHLPAIERHANDRAWRVLDAALLHGRKLLPLTSPFRDERPA